MSRPPEVADVFRNYGPQFLDTHAPSLSGEQKRALRDIAECRTAPLGGHKRRCDSCGYEEISYNSCRNRHCPKCQATARAQWLDKQVEYLLDVEYFHVVFTLPEKLGPLALQNKRQLYGILFRAAAETLSTLARDPKHLGADVGFLAVLHTWGQNLHFHPHLHCVVPGGGLSLDGSRWIGCRKGFFLPVRVLSRLFRGKFLDYLERAYRAGKLSFSGKILSLKKKALWQELMRSLRKREWVIYSKAPFGGPQQVLKYLARYTHRVAISNQRIVSIHDGNVSFRWRDYADGSKTKTMTLQATEFIRRFLLHVLPKSFVHIRHYGFLSNRVRERKLALARNLIEKAHPEKPAPATTIVVATDHDDSRDEHAPTCPRCKRGRLLLVEDLKPFRIAGATSLFFDSS